ncbi:MAG: hypothetical protein M0R03_17205 [Novosphingobium sp.]|nr:hypothetical protein [Novosphingobium sp.]
MDLIKKYLPKTYYAGLSSEERLKMMVEGWQRAIKVNQELEEKLSSPVEPLVMPMLAEVEDEIETKMVGKIIKGNLDGQKVAEQWINVNNAILIAKQIVYKHYSKFSV